MSDLKQTIGKNIYIWSIPEIYGGDIGKIVAALQAGKFQSAVLHSTRSTNWEETQRINLVKALQTVGIHVFGGCAVYGLTPSAEGARVAGFCKKFSLTGWVFDAEVAVDNAKSPDSFASALVKAFHGAAPAGCLAGWCWWACYQSSTGGTWHPKSILWAATSKGYGAADFGMPMVYWGTEHVVDDVASAISNLNSSIEQWRKVTDIPIVPIGRAYIGDGGVPSRAAMIAFEQRARELGMVGVSWWSMQHALDTQHIPFAWATLAEMPPWGESGSTRAADPQPAETDPTAGVHKHWEELDQPGQIERLKTLAVAAGWNVD
jgi:hypothetical protein